ncbi:Glycolipid 2-alpha-mannosyltransferase [Spraguea lophii 42_110]|uniref:Glycolipid 2-alpha-mannosyltransferase n=1 Tax=Spraguea lophii (strain 42_110) TaxID=1358809 RepID=S7XVE7_SPRLO|nr:Glycolipid 2-alpha-mannosyltransferase [Spraguea lophii 42_110]
MIIFLFLINLFCKENAVIMVLCRNEDLDSLLGTLREYEKVFNRKYEYPYVFLNNKDFTEEFKRRVSKEIKFGEFGTLEKYEWDIPDWIDINKARNNWKILENKGIIYGGSGSYRQMCRFFSGFFYRNKLMRKYDYYWRIEPGVRFLCDIEFDPFEYLKENNKDYGFVISVLEYMETIPSLWQETLKFISENIDDIPKNNLNFIMDANNNYNGCHFWTNFEIANLNFFRGHLYQKYFDYLDKTGKFFYERWGDAPVHSIAICLFSGRNKVHFFENIGYEHKPFNHCPSSPEMRSKCRCEPKNSIDFTPYSCLRQFLEEQTRNAGL